MGLLSASSFSSAAEMVGKVELKNSWWFFIIFFLWWEWGHQGALELGSQRVDEGDGIRGVHLVLRLE